MNKLRYRPLSREGLNWAILLLAFALRWPWPLPEWTHVDERAFVLYPLGFWSGDLNPHFFNYPTLTLYLASALYYVYFLLFSAESLEYFVAYRYFVDAADLLAITRTANALVSTGTVAVCMAIGGRVYGRTGGQLAGLLLAVMPLHARFAHLAITDVAAGFFVALAVLYGVRVVQTSGRGDLVLAGVWAGLAAASKYPAGLALVAVLVGCLLSRRRATWVPVAMAGLSFAVASPYTFLDWGGFIEAFAGMAREHLISDGHTSGEPAWWYWLHHNLRYGLGWAGLLALPVSLLWPRVDRRREEWVVLAAAVVFALLLFGASSVFMRYAQPLAPLLAVLLARWGAALSRQRGLLAVWLALLLAEPLYATLQQRALVAGGDTREQARIWLKEHAPQGQRIIQIPKGAGQIPLLKPEQVFVRMDPFIASYGIEGLERALQLLADGPELPELFVDWTLENYRAVEFPGTPDGEMLVLRYDHPLVAMGAEDSLSWSAEAPAVEWLTSFSGGDAAGAVFDKVDWHFAPVGGFGAVDRTGPNIRIGVLPWHDEVPVPTGREVFNAYVLLLAGNKAARAAQWAEAALAYKSLLETPFLLNELFTVSYLYRMFLGVGQVFEQLDDTDAAARAWLRAAKTQLQEAEPYFKLGKMFAGRGQHELSVQHYGKALELAPDDTIVLYNLGIGLMHLGRNAEAVERLERAAVLAPDVETYLSLTTAYGRNGQQTRAMASFIRARELDPNHPQVAAIGRMMAGQR